MRVLVWIVVVLQGLLGGVNAATTARRETANVYAADSGTLLYRETHWVVPGASPERWVLYTCPSGEPFARKYVLPGGAQPDFEIEDGRDGQVEGVRGSGATRQVYVRGATTKAGRRVDVPADGVIDAGFDVAVRARWAALMPGDSIRLQFLVPMRKRFYPVRIHRVESLDWNGIGAERLRMRLDTWFGFAVPDVDLVYARADQRLLEFHGTGNVRDARGRNPQVRITFTPPTESIDAAVVASIGELPLDGNCRI